MKNRTRLLACAALPLLAALPAAIAPAQSSGQSSGPSGAYTHVETGRVYARLQDAVDSVGDTIGTIRIASGRHADCAVQSAGEILFTAAVPGQAAFEGRTCEGKAALVLRGRSARIEGLVFARMAVPDGNGAGIRLEQGNLAVAQSWFRDSQQGILTGNNPTGTITIDRSTFTRLGTCEFSGGCAHSIYIGEYGALTVTRSRFEAGAGGHYVKARAARVGIFNSSFDDSRGKATNYMIDLPAGSTGKLIGNWFLQGRDKENYSAFIAVGAESRTHTSNGLQIEGNDARFAPGVDRNSVFVADWSGDRLAIGYNQLAEGLQRFEKR